MDEALLIALIGVGGIVLGVILSSLIAWIARRLKEGQLKRDIRRVLRWENDYNLEILEDFWRKVTLEPPLQGLPAEVEFEGRMRLANEFLPDWGHTMWRSEAPRLSAVLKHQEFADSYELHSRLDRFAVRRAELQEMFELYLGYTARGEFWNRKAQQQAQVQIEFAQQEAVQEKLRLFNQQTLQIWRECEQIYNAYHHRENPIGDDTARSGFLKRIGRWFVGIPKPKVSWEKPKDVASE